MNKKDFLYSLENAGLIDCKRDENGNIDIQGTIQDSEFNRGFWNPRGEWISLKSIYQVLLDMDVFED